MEHLMPFLMAAVIGIIHFSGEKIDDYTDSFNYLLVSFSAGFTVAYFFSVLLPEVIRNSFLEVQNISIIVGFSMFYILEELLYGREKNFGRIRNNFKEAHTVFISIYHIAIGMILVFLSGKPDEQLLLFFFPVLIHTSVNSLALKEMHEDMLDSDLIKIFVSLSTLIGATISYIFVISPAFLYSLLGIVGGAFIYIVVHDALDPRRERPIGYIAGTLCFLALVSLL